MGEAVLWQERAPHGSWFVQKADGRHVSFGGDKADAEEFCAALNGRDALVKALEEIAADHKMYKGHGDYDEGPHPADYCQTLAREALAKVSRP